MKIFRNVLQIKVFMETKALNLNSTTGVNKIATLLYITFSSS